MSVCFRESARWVKKTGRGGGGEGHSNPSGSGELSELIALYHWRTEVQNWAELSTVQSRG